MDALNYRFYESVANLLRLDDLETLSNSCHCWNQLLVERRQCHVFSVRAHYKLETGQRLIDLTFEDANRQITEWSEIVAMKHKLVRFNFLSIENSNEDQQHAANYEAESAALPKLRFIAARLDPSGTFCFEAASGQTGPTSLLVDPFRFAGMKRLAVSYSDDECVRFVKRHLDFGRVESLTLTWFWPSDAEDLLYRQALQLERLQHFDLFMCMSVTLDLFATFVERAADRSFTGRIDSLDVAFQKEDLFQVILRDFEAIEQPAWVNLNVGAQCFRHRVTKRVIQAICLLFGGNMRATVICPRSTASLATAV